MKKSAALLTAIAITSAIARAQVYIPLTYHVTDLGTLGGGASAESWAYGINDSCQVVGRSWAGGQQGAFLYSNGVMYSTGFNSVTAINASGAFVGQYSSSNDYGYVQYPTNGCQTFGDGQFGAGATTPFAINASGVVVGQSNYFAFTYSNGGTMQSLGGLANHSSIAYGINTSGQIVGWSGHAFLYANGNMQDLRALDGGNQSWAYAISDAGQIVGQSQTNSYPHAVLWQNGTIQDLGALPGEPDSCANAINISGQIVGYSINPGVDDGYAFLITNGVMYNLNSILDSSGEGVVVESATGINYGGYVVGYGTTRNSGVIHALLLTPNLIRIPLP